MGGDDSQKLLPWRGIHSSPGRKPPAQLRINNVTETAGWNLALPPPSLAGLAVASATGRLGHFWKAHSGQFWRAPKPMNSTDWKSISGIVPALPFPVCPKVSPLPSPKKMRLHNSPVSQPVLTVLRQKSTLTATAAAAKTRCGAPK